METNQRVLLEGNFIVWENTAGTVWSDFVKENPFYYLLTEHTPTGDEKEISRTSYYAFRAHKQKQQGVPSIAFSSKDGLSDIHLVKSHLGKWTLVYITSPKTGAMPLNQTSQSLVSYLFAINQNGESDLLDGFFHYIDKSQLQPFAHQLEVAANF